MPILVTGARLRDAVEHQTFIVNGEAQCVEGVKYDFRTSARVLKASYGQPVDIDRLPEAERSAMCVEPGEVVFVLTQERINLPKNMMAVLSPKRKLAHSGIIVLGGFAVDPLFNNRLWVGLYNFSSTKFPIRPGKKLIAALFYELTDDEVGDFAVPESATGDDFPDELVTLIKNYKPVELKGIYEELAGTKRDLAELRTTLTNDKQWKEDFKAALDAHNQQLAQIIAGLEKEISSREKEDTKIMERLDQVGNVWSTFLAGFNVFWLIVAAIVGGVIAVIATNLMG